MKSILTRTRRHDLTFYRNGRIDITSRVAKMLGLTAGDVIDIAIEGMEYYLYVAHNGTDITGRHEAQLYATNHGKVCRNLRCSSKRLTRAVLAMHPDEDVVRLYAGRAEQLITPEGVITAVPIIVRLKV